MRYDAEAASHLESLSPDGSPTRPRGCGRIGLTVPDVGSILAAAAPKHLRRPVEAAPARRAWAWRDASWMPGEYVSSMGFPEWDCVVPYTGITKITVSDMTGLDITARR